MTTRSIEGRVLLGDELQRGALIIDGERIVAFRPGPAPDRILVPGFVDLHVHGGGGADVMDGAEGIAKVAAFHLRRGTTALCPTTVTRPLDELRAVVAAAGSLPDDPSRARLVGVHIEGPFIAPGRLGAQPPFVRAPDLAALDALLDAGPVATVTLAPEVPGALELVRRLRARGVRASLGHSDADHAAASAAFAAGASGVTHLWNAMSGLAHRAPGLAAAALEAEGADLELILDGHHVHPVMLRLALRAARGRVCLVSDAIRATGQGDGATELGGQRVQVERGRATLADGTLAGSVLTLDVALRNAVGAGVPLEVVSRLLSRNPADALGRRDLGRLTPGARADVVELDADLSLSRVWRGGSPVSS